MDRRSFLKGTFTGMAGVGIIVGVSDKIELDKFVKEAKEGESLIVSPPAPYTLDPGMLLFNQFGQPVAVIQRIMHRYDWEDITPLGGQYQQLSPGGHRVEIEAISYGPATLPILSGSKYGR